MSGTRAKRSAPTAIALIWANSGWAERYHHLWETPVTLGSPGFGLTLSLHAWVNDALMAVFFFLVGLELKREVLVGELASLRSATLPIVAAVGGMVVPALLYAMVNRSGAGASRAHSHRRAPVPCRGRAKSRGLPGR